MPITNIHFEDSVFHCHMVGEITPEDAIQWVNQLEQFIEVNAAPIVALVNATECTFITAKARTIFARASAIPNLQSAAIATADFKINQSAHLISMMALKSRYYIFDTVKEATTFIQRQINEHEARV